MEQILEEELGTLSECYLKRIVEEMLPYRMEVMGTSIFDVKVERPMDNQEINTAYYYHLWWRDVGFKVKTFDEKENGNNMSQVGKQKEKNNMGMAWWILPLGGHVIWLFSKVGGTYGSRLKKPRL